MNLKYSGLLFVLFVIAEAINGSTLSGTSAGRSRSGELTTGTAENIQTESQTEVKILIPDKSEIISLPDSKNGDSTVHDGVMKTTKKTTTTTTTSTTTTTTTSTSTTTSTTTPAPEPAPTPSPTPVPAPEKGNWTVRNETSKTTCVIAEMAIQVNVTYPAKDKFMNGILNVPKNATVDGSCSEPNQTMTISWTPGHSLTIFFTANKTTNNFYVSEFVVKVNATVFKDAKDNNTWTFNNRSQEFKTPLKMSYKCNKEQDFNMESDNTNVKAVLSLKDTQIEAYMNKTKAEFGAAQDCDPFDTPDIVPIAVGCALAILVLVVLVAYLIGRKRSQNRGYLSM